MGTTRTGRLRELLARKQILIAPGAYDALTARMIEKVGLAPTFAFMDAEAPQWAVRPGIRDSIKNAWFLGLVTPYIAGG